MGLSPLFSTWRSCFLAEAVAWVPLAALAWGPFRGAGAAAPPAASPRYASLARPTYILTVLAFAGQSFFLGAVGVFVVVYLEAVCGDGAGSLRLVFGGPRHRRPVVSLLGGGGPGSRTATSILLKMVPLPLRSP